MRGGAIHGHNEYKSFIHNSRGLQSYSSEIASGPTSDTKYVDLGKPRKQYSNKKYLFGTE